MSTKRRRNPEATRKAILDAAERLFLERGPAETSTSALAREAGVTKSLIHHHFGSKEGLWSELKQRHFEQYFAAQKAILERDPDKPVGPEILAESIEAYFRFLQSDPRSVKFMSWRFIEEDQTCLDQEDQLFELGIQRIEESQRAGLLRDDIAPLSMIKSFLAMAQQWFQTKPMLCAMLGADAGDVELDEQYLQDLQKIFFAGVKPAD